MPAFFEWRVINLIIIKKETPTAGFKTSKRLCLPQIGRQAVPQHRTTIAETVFLENWCGGVEELACPNNS